VLEGNVTGFRKILDKLKKIMNDEDHWRLRDRCFILPQTNH